MRSPKLDRYMEARFGLPDWDKSFIKTIGGISERYTPLDSWRLWRIDPISFQRPRGPALPKRREELLGGPEEKEEMKWGG